MSDDQLAQTHLTEQADERPSYLEYRQNARKVMEGLTHDGFRRTIEKWIHQEKNRYFELQAEVILLARAAHTLDRLKPKMTDRHEISEAKEGLIHYNHAVRNLIWNNPKSIFTDDLTSWMAQSTGDEAWARGIVSGAAGEVAVARALHGLAGVIGVRLGSVEEDRKGMDVVLTITGGDRVSVDVKAHNHLPGGDQFVELKPTWVEGKRYHQCELGVESHHISDGAVLDVRAHRLQLSAIQDYLYGFVSRQKQSLAI